MRNIFKIFCLALSVVLILSLVGCKKNKDINNSSSSDISYSKKMSEYSVSQTEDGKDVVVDKDGKVVENAKITDSGDIEITDKKTGKTVKTIPKAEVKKYEEVSSKETGSTETKTTDSSSQESATPSGSSQTDSKKNNNTSTASPGNKQNPSTSKEMPTTSQPTQPSQPSTPPSQEAPSTVDTSVMTQAELNSVAEYFFQLVNQERARVGVQPLTRNGTLDKAAKIRATETIQKWGHVRPNGKAGTSVLTDVKYGTPGEDIWSDDGITWNKEVYYRAGEDGEILTNAGSFSCTSSRPSAIQIATNIFNAYKNSTGHYNSMINKNFNFVGIGMDSYYLNNVIVVHHIALFTEK